MSNAEEASSSGNNLSSPADADDDEVIELKSSGSIWDYFNLIGEKRLAVCLK